MGSGSLNFSCSEFGLLLGSILLLDFLIDIDTERCFAYRILSAYSQIYLKSADSAESAEFSYIVVACVASVTLPIWKRPLKSTDVSRVHGQRAEDLRRASPGAVILKARWRNQQSIGGQDTDMII